MPNYPPAIIAKVAAAIERELMSGTYYDTHVESEEALARVALDAVAADLGEAVAAKILAAISSTGPEIPPPRVHDTGAAALRRHYRAAARIAALAFLTEDDKLRMTATALAAGDFIACPAPEDSDER